EARANGCSTLHPLDHRSRRRSLRWLWQYLLGFRRAFPVDSHYVINALAQRDMKLALPAAMLVGAVSDVDCREKSKPKMIPRHAGFDDQSIGSTRVRSLQKALRVRPPMDRRGPRPS